MSEEKESKRAEINSKYIAGTYRGAYFSEDTDQDCWVKMVEAYLHGKLVYQSDWIDITDTDYSNAEHVIDRFLADEANIYANEYDFRNKCLVIMKDATDERYYRFKQSTLGYFIMDDILVYAAATLSADREPILYGEIPKEIYLEFSRLYEECANRKNAELIELEVIKFARLFYLIGGDQKDSRDKFTKKDMYSLNAKFYRDKETGVIYYFMHEKGYFWEKNKSDWVSFAWSDIEDNPNIVPISFEDALEEITQFHSFVQRFEKRNKADKQQAKKTSSLPSSSPSQSIKQPMQASETKQKTPLADPKRSITLPKQSNKRILKLFTPAVIMNYIMTGILFISSIICLCTGNFLDSAVLAIVPAIYAGLNFWFQKTKSDIPAFLLLFGMAIINFVGVCVFSANEIALFAVIGLSFNAVLGFPARLFAFIIAKQYKS